jgi:hypothetical protein
LPNAPANSDVLSLRIDGAAKTTIYLSVSWQPDQGKTFGYRIVKRLDEKGILVVGDVKRLDTMDLDRIARIMRGANGFICVLPFRPNNACKTSEPMLDELRVAIRLGLPVAVLADDQIKVAKHHNGQNLTLRFPDGTEIDIPSNLARLVNSYYFGDEPSEEVRIGELAGFLQGCSSHTVTPPYAFLVTRLQPDFELPRHAIVAAVQNAAGIPCIWVDSKNVETNFPTDTIARVRHLIKHSTFVVAEISLTDEHNTQDNPSRAHEIGLATAFGKQIILAAHTPRRAPYHGVIASQLIWWDNETDLYQQLRTQLHTERATTGRHVYNWDLPTADPRYVLTLPRVDFQNDPARAWTPPRNFELPEWLGWFYAGSFSLLVICAAVLLKRFIDYDGTLDLVAILAGVTTFLFSSSLSNKLYRVLGSVSFLRWLIPLCAFLLLCATIVLVALKKS